MIDILKTQMLDVTFVVRYILNQKYQLDDVDDNINAQTVLKYQPHITFEELQKAFYEYESDDDSVTDFETVANREK